MTDVFITAAAARQNARSELTIHTEVRTLEDAILQASADGYYEVTVSTGTPMTDTTVINTVVSNVDVGSSTLIITDHPYQTGSVVTVQSTGTLPTPLTINTYYYVIYTDANTIRLAASLADALNPVPVNIILSSTGTDVISVNLFNASQDYYSVLKNLPTSNMLNDRPYQDQMNSVISYFTSLGYTMLQQTNTQTNNTFQWNIKW